MFYTVPVHFKYMFTLEFINHKLTNNNMINTVIIVIFPMLSVFVEVKQLY